MPSRWLACLLCSACTVCSAHPLLERVVPIDAARLGVQLAAGVFGQHTIPADDDDALAISLLRHATVGGGAIHWRVLRPRLSITDPDSGPLMVIAALWAAFLVALGVAHWRDRKASKIVQ